MVITVLVAVFTRSRDSAFGTVNGVKGWIGYGQETLPVKTYRLAVGLIQPYTQWVLWVIPSEVKQSIPEHDHSPPSGVGIIFPFSPYAFNMQKNQYFTSLHQSLTACIRNRTGKDKVKEIPVQVYYRRIGVQDVEAPKFLDNRHRLPLFLQEIYSLLFLILCFRAS